MKGLARLSEARPKSSSGLDSAGAAAVLAAASDLALVLDDAGVIRELSLGRLDPPLEEAKSWLGQRWIDTVTPESQPRILALLREAGADGVSRRWQVQHLSASGSEIPIDWTALRRGDGSSSLLAIGSDLRGASLQQRRLVEAQQSLERDYRRMREFESRFRLIFNAAAEALLIVDATTQKVVEANPAAGALFGQPVRKLVGRGFPFEVDRGDEPLVAEQLALARREGKADDAVVRLGHRRVALSVSLLQQGDGSCLLVRLVRQEGAGEAGRAGAPAGGTLRLLESLADGFVLTDGDGRILSANRAFLEMIEVPVLDQVRGQPLARWIGRPGADMVGLLGTLRDHGVVRLFGTSLLGDLGSTREVEVSCAVAPDRAAGQLGFLIRDVGRRLALGPRGARDLTRAVEDLTALVGRVALKGLVRDTTDLVERHFIAAALEATGGNRTAAAAVLGVSRQSLYVKLRRYDLGETPSGEVTPAARYSKRLPKKKRRKR